MKSSPLILSALAGGLAVGLICLGFWASPTASAATSFGGEQRLAELERVVDSNAALHQSLSAAVQKLVGRMESLDDHVSRQALPESRGSALPKEEVNPAAGQTGPVTAVGEFSTQEFQDLMSRVVRASMGGSDSTGLEDQQRFWEAARRTTLVDDAIGRLEALIAENPQDQEVRMDLADAYVAKLLTVPASPERGIWGMKAEGQWQEILAQNPDHWEAQYVLAYDYSMYPDFVAKTEEAIAGFEAALRIQERVQPRPEHAMTYVQLARMHTKKGDNEDARRVLELGQARHPGNQEIAEALRSLRDG